MMLKYLVLTLVLCACEEPVQPSSYPANWTDKGKEMGVGVKIAPRSVRSAAVREKPQERTWKPVGSHAMNELSIAFRRYVDVKCKACFSHPETVSIGANQFLRFRHFKHPIRLVKLDGQWFDDQGRTVVGGALARPVRGEFRIISDFGVRMHPLLQERRAHMGSDYAAPIGAKVFAIRSGRVSRIFKGKRSGLTVELDHGEGRTSVYRHLSNHFLRLRQQVVLGEVIAEVGASGAATGPHLHFEYELDGVPVPWTRENLRGLPASLEKRRAVHDAFRVLSIVAE